MDGKALIEMPRWEIEGRWVLRRTDVRGWGKKLNRLALGRREGGNLGMVKSWIVRHSELNQKLKMRK